MLIVWFLLLIIFVIGVIFILLLIGVILSVNCFVCLMGLLSNDFWVNILIFNCILLLKFLVGLIVSVDRFKLVKFGLWICMFYLLLLLFFII